PCWGGGTSCAAEPIPSGLLLSINVTQTLPTAAGPVGIPGAALAGSVSGTTSSAVATWPLPNKISIGPISYSLFNLNLNLAPPSVGSGDTVVLGLIEAPEPGALGSIALVASALVLAARRKR